MILKRKNLDLFYLEIYLVSIAIIKKKGFRVDILQSNKAGLEEYGTS